MTMYYHLSPLAHVLYGLTGIILATAAIFALVNVSLLHLGRERLWRSIALAVSALLALQGLADVSAQLETARFGTAFGGFVGRLPEAAVALALCVLAVAETVMIIDLLRAKRSMLTPDSVKECLDALPDGVCFSAPDGQPLLTNMRMNTLSMELFGTVVMNNERCWQRLAAHELTSGVEVLRDEPTTVVRVPDGTVWELRRSALRPERGEVIETAAFDVTEQYELNRELEDSNRVLSRVNERLRRYSREVANLTRETETLAAKIRVHDDIGRALLTFRTYLVQPPEERDRDELLRLWRHNISVMKNEADPTPESDALTLLRAAADAVDVRLVITGELPPDKRRRTVIIEALHECLTNMVRHAGGDELRIALKEGDGCIRADITNNGRAPEAEIREGGGLGDLRRRVELSGGEMEITSLPAFVLHITLPRR